MSVMATCLGRLGSRYSLALDPHRNTLSYGALGMACQESAQMVIGLQRDNNSFVSLPFCSNGERFFMLDQQSTATSLIYDAFDLEQAIQFRTEIISPFWPQDIATSTLPAYIVKFHLKPVKRIRSKVFSCEQEPEYWSYWNPNVVNRKGTLRVGFKIPGVTFEKQDDRVRFEQPVEIKPIGRLQGDGNPFRTGRPRSAATHGSSDNLMFGLSGNWQACDGFLEVPYDLTDDTDAEFCIGFCTYCSDALFERFGEPMRLKYTDLWSNVDDVAAYVKKNDTELLRKSASFNQLLDQSSLPLTCQQVTSFSFQTYLMNTMWTVGDEPDGKEWFSVWEGNCLLNSTVDVEYNNALFYFACWPELLEMLFEQWSQHANNAEDERKRIAAQPQTDLHADSWAKGGLEFPGRVLEHDMGAGWTANGQSYVHAMPVEENSNFLLMLYAHGKWWGRETLFSTYRELVKDLATFLLFTDSTGNGFADIGTANTIDDGCPALQYGRDGVYLGIKRLAALHAARRMLDCNGDRKTARQCQDEVDKAITTLEKGWIKDHYAVCLDASGKGLLDANTAKPVPFDIVPGWDDYSIHTANGLLYLMMADDIPKTMNLQKIKQDIENARRATLTPYGCYHLGKDDFQSIWVSLNIWRDVAAGYVGIDLLSDCDRYWNLQQFSNSAFADKVNCFTETAQNNNLTVYPRSAASFGLPFSIARLKMDHKKGRFSADGIRPGNWPLLPMADWQRGIVPFAVVELTDGRLSTKIVEKNINALMNNT